MFLIITLIAKKLEENWQLTLPANVLISKFALLKKNTVFYVR